MSLVTLSNGVTIRLEIASIVDSKVDVIVNSTNLDLKLNTAGSLSNEISRHAGAGLQEECNRKYPDGFEQGSLALTGTHNLHQKMICHVSIPPYSSDENLHVHMAGHHSVAFPAFGCGASGYPKPLVAKAVVDTVVDFLAENATVISDVMLVIQHSEKEAIEEFENVFAQLRCAPDVRILPACSPQSPDLRRPSNRITTTSGKQPDDPPKALNTFDGNFQMADAQSAFQHGSSFLRASRGQLAEGERTSKIRHRRMGYHHNNNQTLNTSLGFIRVRMNLIHPISMSKSSRRLSIYDVLTTENESDSEDTINHSHDTSFFMPKDTTKVIYIDSETTAGEVIMILLSKFKISDNPSTFALYEEIYNDDRAGNELTMRRLGYDERPLLLYLSLTEKSLKGKDSTNLILQENDAGNILWDAFSVPELENFLKVLNKEKEEYVNQVKNKYKLMKMHISRRLKEMEK